MTGDDDRISDVERRSMRILATSTKAAGPSNARIADRLERAAGTGDPEDYRKAEASFDALPVNERRRIGTHAEKQAETQRQLEEVRRRRAAEPAPAPKRAPAADDTLDWKPMLLSHSPATDAPDEPAPKPIPKAIPNPGRGPERASGAVAAVPRPSGPRPAAAASATAGSGVPGKVPGKAPATARAPATPRAAVAAAPPPRPKKPLMTIEPGAPGKRDEDPEKGWDWQRIPEDPVLKATRKKPVALDPIEELRRQMLGDDTKRR